jgi:hypothetical protein
VWEASVLRPASYSSSTAEALATLESALSKSSSGLLLGPSLSLVDVSLSWCCLSEMRMLQQHAWPHAA